MQIELPIHSFYHINFFENTGFFSLLIRPVELGRHRNIFIELHFVCIELFLVFKTAKLFYHFGSGYIMYQHAFSYKCNERLSQYLVGINILKELHSITAIHTNSSLCIRWLGVDFFYSVSRSTTHDIPREARMSRF